jgi:hypothetical protein
LPSLKRPKSPSLPRLVACEAHQLMPSQEFTHGEACKSPASRALA